MILTGIDYRLPFRVMVVVVALLWQEAGAATGTVTDDDSALTAFAHANAALRLGEPSEAIDGYARLLADGHVSAALYFNLGQAWRRVGQGERATLFLRRAWRRAPWDRTVARELRHHLRDSGIPPPALPLWLRWSAWWSRPGNQAFFAVLYLLLWLPVILKGWRIRLARAMAWAALLIALTTLSAGLITTRIRRQPEAVVTQPQAAMMAPIASSRSHFTLSAGALVGILNAHQGWLRIEDGGGRIGWVPAGGVERL